MVLGFDKGCKKKKKKQKWRKKIGEGNLFWWTGRGEY